MHKRRLVDCDFFTMFKVDPSVVLSKHGFTIDDNAMVTDGRLCVRQESTYDSHKVIAVFILIIDSERKIPGVTCNVVKVHNNHSGWGKFNAKVISLLQNDCCNHLKDIILPPDKKKIID